MPRLQRGALTIVIPVYDEADRICGVLEELADHVDRLPDDRRVWILNDGSNDWSEELEQRLERIHPVQITSFYPNRGKGAMVDAAMPELETEYAVIIDADGEYAVSDIEQILAPLQARKADWVLGARYGFGRERPRQYLATYLVNRLINAWFFVLSGQRLVDLLTGIYGFRVQSVDGIRLREQRFSYTAELLWNLRRRGARLLETPVAYRFRRYAEGKKIRWWETATLLAAFWRYRSR